MEKQKRERERKTSAASQGRRRSPKNFRPLLLSLSFHFLCPPRAAPNHSLPNPNRQLRIQKTTIIQIKSNDRDYPTSADAYELLEECGRGVSATVWRARVVEPSSPHLGEDVAVKLMDLESASLSLDEIVREAATMRAHSHPNVLPLLTSFVDAGARLWMVMPFVAGGSVLNIMRFAFPDGLEEPVIATVMKEVLKGLCYVHASGAIHRDVKAGNILVGADGGVMLADFGVAATMERQGSWGSALASRSTFVGTPCWMAPEVMEQSAAGYSTLADIWSFGITLLELAHGHAPFAKYPPMKVLLMTIQNPPPTLDGAGGGGGGGGGGTGSTSGGEGSVGGGSSVGGGGGPGKKHFSKAMRDIVAKCLVKDPTKRPTAAALLEHKFFKTAHEPNYLVKHLLAGLPSVPERARLLREGRRGGGASRAPSAEAPPLPPPPSAAAQAQEDAASQQAYVRGVSSWNFDIPALKAAAASGGGGEGDDDGGAPQRLPTLTEGNEGGGAAPAAPAAPAAASALPPPASAPVRAATKRAGRFEVYEGDEMPPLSPSESAGAGAAAGGALPSSALGSREPSATAEGGWASPDRPTSASAQAQQQQQQQAPGVPLPQTQHHHHPPPPPPLNVGSDLDSGAPSPAPGTAGTAGTGAGARGARKAGRFQIVQDDFGPSSRSSSVADVALAGGAAGGAAGAGAAAGGGGGGAAGPGGGGLSAGLGRAGSVGGDGGGLEGGQGSGAAPPPRRDKSSPGGPQLGSLLPPLKDMLESMAEQVRRSFGVWRKRERIEREVFFSFLPHFSLLLTTACPPKPFLFSLQKKQIHPLFTPTVRPPQGARLRAPGRRAGAPEKPQLAARRGRGARGGQAVGAGGRAAAARGGVAAVGGDEAAGQAEGGRGGGGPRAEGRGAGRAVKLMDAEKGKKGEKGKGEREGERFSEKERKRERKNKNKERT